jgi:glutamine cyclotransferase
MKKIGIIVILIALIGAFVIVPLMDSGNGTETEDMATLKVKGNIQAVYGASIPVSFSIPAGLEKVELIYNDSTFKSWSKPVAQEQTIALKTNFYGVGTRPLLLRSTFSDGTVLESTTLVRVISDITPKLKRVKIEREYPHNKENYTQGFEFDGNQLYESTGDPGQQGKTMLGMISLENGAFNGPKNGLDATYFGEGITILGDKLYQLTWQNQKCFVYDKKTMQVTGDFSYQGEGWGMCNDGKSIITSDGTEYLYFRNPKNFQIDHYIQVYDNIGPRTNLNELEYIDGKIYANVYTTSTLVVIDPNTGKVLEEIDASELVTKGKNGGDVLNGIAYNRLNKKLYLTGKYWSLTFEVSLTE